MGKSQFQNQVVHDWGGGTVCSDIALISFLCFAGQFWDEAVEKEVVCAG